MAAKIDTTDAKKIIIKALSKKGLNTPALAETTGLAPNVLAKALAELKAESKIEFVGTKRTGCFSVVK